ncbi:hypothetical protein FE257_006657 [Aspergillus nanangensis]|uniref:Uncharacterized protein n=1 Tax=Aspergillus nanangensis TaxID=2582783 RepID=A0AAD4CZU9_ASPNN|nr:hypothetical protein FE257_006657 [Aspergillus nanangensis]
MESLVLIRMPPLNWHMQRANKSSYLLIDVDYGVISEEMAASATFDLMTIQRLPQHRTCTFQETLETFLAQFHELSSRRPNHFELSTEQMFSDAAHLQVDLLRELSTNVTDLSSDTTVIALCLECLSIVEDIDHIIGQTVALTEDELFEDGSPVVLVEPDDDDRAILPTIEAHKLTQTPTPSAQERKPGFHLDSGLDSMLDYIVHQVFRLLDSQDPRHWPTVLYVLLILEHIRGALMPHQPWMQKVHEASRWLNHTILEDLARYYYIYTDGGLLLSDRWDEKAYSRRVGDDQLAIRHARMLNQLWLDLDDGDWDRREGRTSLGNFRAKVEFFAYGCAI